MLADFEGGLSGFTSNSAVVRLLTGVLGKLKGESALEGCGGLKGFQGGCTATMNVDGVADAGLAVAEVTGALDGGEIFVGVATPARTALSLFDAHVEWAPGINDLEDEHGLDAITRLVGVGLIAEGLSDGDSDEAANEFLKTEGGRGALAWFAAVEVTLAYGTDDEPIDGDKLIELLDAFFDDAMEIWADLASERALARARIIVNNWTDVLCPAISALAGQVQGLADIIRGSLHSGESDVESLKAEARDIAVYCALTARHIGENIHGPPASSLQTEPEPKAGPEPEAEPEPESESESELQPAIAPVRLAMDGAQSILAALQAELLEASASANSGRETMVSLVGQINSIESQRAQAKDDHGVLVAEYKPLAKQSQTPAKKLMNLQARVDAASGDLAAAEAVALSAQALIEVFGDPSDRSQTMEGISVGSALRTQLSGSRKVAQQLRSQLEVWGQLSELTKASVAEVERGHAALSEQLEPLRSRLKERRKERVAVTRAQVSHGTQGAKSQSRLEGAKSEMDDASKSLREMKEGLGPLQQGIKASSVKAQQRENRANDLARRMSDAEGVVSELSGVISGLRGSIEGVTTRILARIDVKNEERQALLTEIQSELGHHRKALSAAREHWAPAVSSATAVRTKLKAMVSASNEANRAASECRERLESIQTKREELHSHKVHSRKLAGAALDMLRNCAGRLEGGHEELRKAQSGLDRLTKERKLRLDRLDGSERSIAAATEAENKAVSSISVAQSAVEDFVAALERNASMIEVARQRESERRVKDADTTRERIEKSRRRIEGLRGQISDAKEDKEGLGAVEVKTTSTRIQVIGNRELLRAQVDTLRAAHSMEIEALGLLKQDLAARGERLAEIDAELVGAALTIRGFVANRKKCDGRVGHATARVRFLRDGLASARTLEDGAVERVADVQCWVDRSRAAQEKLKIQYGRVSKAAAAALIPPAPPPVKPEAAPASKLDNLLARVQRNPGAVENVPDPSAAPEVDGAATMVYGKSQLLEQVANDAEATQILEQVANDAEATQIFRVEGPVESGEAATEMFSPEDLLAKLQEGDENATAMMPRTRRRPVRTRTDKGQESDDSD